MIDRGMKVFLEYTVRLVDGTQVDTNIGDDPLVFVLGESQIFPALEQALLGLKIGDVKTIVLQPEEAYGPVVQDAYREVDIEIVPREFRFVGAILGVQDPSSDNVFPIRVHQVRDDKAILDFNHPLAGQALHFDVKVLHAE